MLQLHDFPRVMEMIAQAEALMNHSLQMNTIRRNYGLIAMPDFEKEFAKVIKRVGLHHAKLHVSIYFAPVQIGIECVPVI